MGVKPYLSVLLLGLVDIGFPEVSPEVDESIFHALNSIVVVFPLALTKLVDMVKQEAKLVYASTYFFIETF